MQSKLRLKLLQLFVKLWNELFQGGSSWRILILKILFDQNFKKKVQILNFSFFDTFFVEHVHIIDQNSEVVPNKRSFGIEFEQFQFNFFSRIV